MVHRFLQPSHNACNVSASAPGKRGCHAHTATNRFLHYLKHVSTSGGGPPTAAGFLFHALYQGPAILMTGLLPALLLHVVFIRQRLEAEPALDVSAPSPSTCTSSSGIREDGPGGRPHSEQSETRNEPGHATARRVSSGANGAMDTTCESHEKPAQHGSGSSGGASNSSVLEVLLARLAFIDSWCVSLAQRLEPKVVTFVVCTSIALYYYLYALLARLLREVSGVPSGPHGTVRAGRRLAYGLAPPR